MRTMCESLRTLANFHAYPRILSRTSANSCVSAREPTRIRRELLRTSRIRRELSYICIYAIYAYMDRELSRIRRELSRIRRELPRICSRIRVFVENFCELSRIRRELSRIHVYLVANFRVFVAYSRELSRTLANSRELSRTCAIFA